MTLIYFILLLMSVVKSKLPREAKTSELKAPNLRLATENDENISRKQYLLKGADSEVGNDKLQELYQVASSWKLHQQKRL